VSEVILRSVIGSPAAWLGSDLADPSRWTVQLEGAHVGEILRALDAAKAKGATVGSLTREGFPLPTLGAEVRRWAETLDRGLGFVLVRGFPVSELGKEDAALAYFGLGLHLGEPVPQNTSGDLLGHVTDHGVPRSGPAVRLYMTRDKQDFHTDGADVIGLLCLQRARSGGLSRIVSSVSIYKEILRRRPDLASVLYEPFPFKGEFLFELPICTVHAGRLRTFYIGWYIRDAQEDPAARRLTPAQSEVLPLLESIANDPRCHLDMDFQIGDIQLINNASILHARTAYEDFPEPERKRHLLRLWLRPHDFSSVEQALSAGIPQEHLR
jgi:hypothetical protein